jgi:hypothetical protein
MGGRVPDRGAGRKPVTGRALSGTPPRPRKPLDRRPAFAHKAGHDDVPHHRDLHYPLTSVRGARPVPSPGPM